MLPAKPVESQMPGVQLACTFMDWFLTTLEAPPICPFVAVDWAR